ncbi:GAF domain-containing protein [Haloarcula litorea]|uniref:GAF domain-containing protein n=1 Tax=Haloarcula litorea TaxID=3032579 RepID=UPI0023E89E4F|nr:GAF domain-containing protein [Halomicroarcula sp. GDY20]
MRGDEESTLRALHEVATDIRDLDSRAAVCRRAVEAAEQVLAFDHCAVSLERDGRLPIVASSSGFDTDTVATLSADEGLAGRAYQTGESLLMNDAAASDIVEEDDRFDVALTVPLGDHGVFQAVRASADPFEEADRDLGELLCSHVAQALDRLDRERRLEARNETLADSERRTRKVQSVTEDLIDADNRRGVATRIVDAARDVFTLPLSGVHLYDESRDVLAGVAATSAVARELGEVPDYACDGGTTQQTVWDIYESGEPLVVADVRSDDRVRAEGSPVRSLIVHPLGDHGVYILSSTDPKDFDRTDVALADLLASTATAAMDQIAHRRDLERYRTVVETVPDGVFLLDEAGTMRQVNDAWADIVGYDHDDLAGEPFQLLVEDGVIDEHIVETYLDTIRQLLSSETDRRSAAFVTELRPADGTGAHTYEVHLRLLPYDDSFQGVAGVVRDVTERVEQQRELERENERLDEFASIVSHDLRNPLGVARGSLELAAETGEQAHFDRCERSLDRMETLIDDLLTLSRAGETVGSVGTVALDEIAFRGWAVVETDGADLAVETAASLRADEGRLRQLLENLFRNAVEHGSTGSRTGSDDAVEHGSTDPLSQAAEDAAEHGGGTVQVTVGALDDGFYVADDGPGIPEDERENLFESGYTTSDSGTGFGLAIVQQIADAHGWSVRATESAAGGARFEVSGVEFADDAQ